MSLAEVKQKKTEKEMDEMLCSKVIVLVYHQNENLFYFTD